jgi:uncharacterized protein with HEPN domain
MRPEARKYLWDANHAAELISRFTATKTFGDFSDDLLLRSAVERQFEIIGEALARLLRLEPDVASSIADVRSIIGFRNVIAHGYDSLDITAVWGLIQGRLPELRDTLRDLLAQDEPGARDIGAL